MALHLRCWPLRKLCSTLPDHANPEQNLISCMSQQSFPWQQIFRPRACADFECLILSCSKNQTKMCFWQETDSGKLKMRSVLVWTIYFEPNIYFESHSRNYIIIIIIELVLQCIQGKLHLNNKIYKLYKTGLTRKPARGLLKAAYININIAGRLPEELRKNRPACRIIGRSIIIHLS